MTAQLGQTASLTDTGRKRRHNEDAYVVEPPLFAVADGMGGAQAGELASSLAAAALKDVQEPGGGGEERVDELIQQANRRVYERQSQDAVVGVNLVQDGADVRAVGLALVQPLVPGGQVRAGVGAEGRDEAARVGQGVEGVDIGLDRDADR